MEAGSPGGGVVPSSRPSDSRAREPHVRGGRSAEDRMRSCLFGRSTVRDREYTTHGQVARATYGADGGLETLSWARSLCGICVGPRVGSSKVMVSAVTWRVFVG